MLGDRGLFEKLRGVAREKIDEAKRKEDAGDLAGAAEDLNAAAGMIGKMADSAKNLNDATRLNAKAQEYREKATRLQSGVRGGAGRQHEAAGADEYRASVKELIYRDSSVTWDDIGGMKNVKATLKYAMGLMLAKPPEGVSFSPPSRFLLYGPPGTGKTLLAAACAKMLEATFFNVKASDLLSKYFGESAKLISALFAEARSEADTGSALVFIDEVDALSGERGSQSESGAERRILSTLLAELDGVSEKGRPSRVITVVATNRPWDIDPGILDRFEKHVLVDLPDEAARRAIFAIHTEKVGFKLAGDVTLDFLTAKTKGYSGRLISRVCKEAIEAMVRDVNEDIPKYVDDRSINTRQVSIRPLTKTDFELALGRHKPRPKEASLSPYKKWASTVGGEQA